MKYSPFTQTHKQKTKKMKTSTLLAIIAVLLAYFASSTHAIAHHQPSCYNYDRNSIVDVMKKNNMDSSVKARIAIANKLNIPYVSPDENPTARMNIELLTAVKKMIALENETSIVNWLKLKEMKSSVKARIELAKELQVPYVAKATMYPTAKMNIDLLKVLKSQDGDIEVTKVIVANEVPATVPHDKNSLAKEVLPLTTQQSLYSIPVTPNHNPFTTSETPVVTTNPAVIILIVPVQVAKEVLPLTNQQVSDSIPMIFDSDPVITLNLNIVPKPVTVTKAQILFRHRLYTILLIIAIASLIYFHPALRRRRFNRDNR
mgnify:CR=1 FL=1